jgi:hypothetical protein
MPRKSPGHDQRIITYRALPGSSRQYQRVNVAECTAWVQTNLEFDQTRRTGVPVGPLRPTRAASSRPPKAQETASRWSEKWSTMTTTDSADQHNSPA